MSGALKPHFKGFWIFSVKFGELSQLTCFYLVAVAMREREKHDYDEKACMHNHSGQVNNVLICVVSPQTHATTNRVKQGTTSGHGKENKYL